MTVNPQSKSLPMKTNQLICMLGIVVAWARIHPALAAEATKVLLAVLAHPDDDLVCAGTLARPASAGWEVTVIDATSREAGEDISGQKLKGAALGRERERESRKSLTALGVKRPPVYLRFGDGTLAKVQQRLSERLAKELAGTGAAQGVPARLPF